MYKCVQLTHCMLHLMPYVNYISVKTEKEGKGGREEGEGREEDRKGPVHSSKMAKGECGLWGPCVMSTRCNSSSQERERGCPEAGDNMVRGLLSLQVCTNCCRHPASTWLPGVCAPEHSEVKGPWRGRGAGAQGSPCQLSNSRLMFISELEIHIKVEHHVLVHRTAWRTRTF